MAEEELQIVRLKAEFYRDGFGKVLLLFAMILSAVVGMACVSAYLFMTKPNPVYFHTIDNEWRVLAPVPLNVPYLSDADLSQWVGQALVESFTYDFLNYQRQQQDVMPYYSQKGLQSLQGQLNRYHLDYDSFQKTKIFSHAQLAGAPYIFNEGFLPDEGKYAWDVQIPVNVSYSNGIKHSLALKLRVKRVSTLNYLYGVTIDEMTITESQGNQVKTNG